MKHTLLLALLLSCISTALLSRDAPVTEGHSATASEWLVLKIALTESALTGTVSPSYPQRHVVLGIEKVYGKKTLFARGLKVAAGASFLVKGTVNYRNVDTLTVDGGFSEKDANGQAVYADPCTTPTGGSGTHIFGDSVALTTINGSHPLRIYDVALSRSIQLDNEWQIAHALSFQKGTIATRRDDTSHFVHFLAGSTYTLSASSSHINGYAAWSGNGPFTLPLGSGSKRGLLALNGACGTRFKGAYFQGNPATATLPAGAPFPNNLRQAGLQAVSNVEYWDLDGQAPTAITLHFDAQSNLATLTNDIARLTVVAWNGSQWVDLGNAGHTGTLGSGGTLTSNTAIPDQYRAFTFGVRVPNCSYQLVSQTGSDSQSLCLNAPLASIRYKTTTATGIAQNGIAGANGLPAGVSATWAADTLRITGTPSNAGVFSYAIPLLGCQGDSIKGRITVHALPSAAIASNNPANTLTCTTPSLTLSASGGASYTWSNGLPASPTVLATSAGTYTVTATNANGCSDTASITLTEDKTPPVAAIANLAPSNVLTCAQPSIRLLASGGGAYLWNGGLGTAAEVSVVAAGTYSVTVSAANGCTSMSNIQILEDTQPPQVSIRNNSGTNVLTCDQTSISLSAQGDGTYSWGDGLGSTADISISQPGTYRVTVTGANGCIGEANLPITEDKTPVQALITALENSGNSNDNLLCAASSVTLVAEGGVSYLWGSGETTAQISPLVSASQEYTVRVTGANGCSGQASIQIALTPPVTLSAVVNNTCTGSSSGAIRLSASGGTPAYSYRWSNGAAGTDLAGLSAGTYGVTVEDANGCTAAQAYTVTGSLAAPTLGILAPDAVCAGSPVTVILQPSEALRIQYQVGTGAIQTLNTLSEPVSLNLGNLSGNTDLFVRSATSLASGCALASGGIQKAIQTLSAPVLASENLTTCSGEPFRITPQVVAGASPFAFADWKADYNGLTGGTTSGSGLSLATGAIAEQLLNTSASVTNAVYTLSPYTQTGGLRCAGQDVSFVVSVQPAATVNPVSPLEVCSGAIFQIPLSSNTPGAALSWSRTGAAGALAGIGDIADALRNEGSTEIEVSYEVKASASGCPGTATSVNVVVKPTPVLKLTPPADACDGFVDLSAAAVTAGSAPGLSFSYWKDRNLTEAVENTAKAPAGLYFVKAQDAAGCAASGSVLARTAIRLNVVSPDPLCAGSRADLTATAVTAGSDPGLRFTYWLDEAATRALETPTAAAAGRYYIKAEAAGGTCFAIQSLEVRETRPQLSNATATLQACSGTAFRFIPQSSVPGAEFDWRREDQAGIANPAGTGVGEINETLDLTGAAVRVRYTYRLKAAGCSLVGAESGTLEVDVQPLPEFSVVDSVRICSPTVSLNTLVSNPLGHSVQFSTDAAGQSLLADPSKALPGQYFAVAKSSAGCVRTKVIQVASEVSAPMRADTTLVVCPPATADLTALVAASGAGASFRIAYFSDRAAQQAIANPAAVGAGNYYVQWTENSARGCQALVPVGVQSGLASMNSPLTAPDHCGGTAFSYTPTSTSRGISFRWAFLSANGLQVDTAQGAGSISVLLSNPGDSVRTGRFRIVASSAACPQTTATYQVAVPVLPQPGIVPIASPISIYSGDSLVVAVAPVRPIGAARFNWQAEYGKIKGGAGKGTNLSFGARALVEQLFNFSDTAAEARYTLTPVLSGAKACPGPTVAFTVSVAHEGAQGPASIAGALYTNFGTAIEGVELSLSGQSRSQTLLSNASGNYRFAGLRALYDYTVRPQHDRDLLNGVSTRDLLVLQQHLLGTKPLSDPYRLIAADVNASRSVTIADLLWLRKAILAIENRFPGNTSWRFVAADYRFPRPSSPWTPAFPELKNINDLENSASADFIGVKIGDLTGDARPNTPLGATIRNGAPLTLQTEDRFLRRGETVLLPIAMAGSEPWDGMQFTLQYERRALRLLPAESMFAREESTGLFPEDGLLTYSWDKAIQPGETVMLLRFEVLQNGRCSEWLAINSRLTPAEAYIGEQTRPLVLDFNSKDPQGALPSLLQNYPNPYLGETVIGFHLPSAAEATLIIQDVVGRTLRVIKGAYAQGYNQVLLKASELQATGVLYYTLESGGFRSTRKMVIGGD